MRPVLVAGKLLQNLSEKNFHLPQDSATVQKILGARIMIIRSGLLGIL